jgi:hypothetical protein
LSGARFDRPAQSAPSGRISYNGYRETGLSPISFPVLSYPKCASMKPDQKIPYYAPDGRSLGFRTAEAAKRLIDGGFVKPSYGRKGHLKAIWLRRDDGTSPVEARVKLGTRYSFIETLENGRCWRLRKLRLRDEDGVEFNVEPAFFSVVQGCLAR